MAKSWSIKCESPSESSTIHISEASIPLPYYSSWSADPNEWGLNGGAVNWTDAACVLGSGTATPAARLEGFTKTSSVDDSGSGDKLTLGGSFSDGKFTWTLESIS